MTNPTIETKFGTASYSISAAGCLSLNWENVALKRTAYLYAHAYETRDKYRPDVKRLEVFAARTDGKQASSAALAAFRSELERLAPVLVSPEACARAEFAASVAAAMEFFAEATT